MGELEIALENEEEKTVVVEREQEEIIAVTVGNEGEKTVIIDKEQEEELICIFDETQGERPINLENENTTQGITEEQDPTVPERVKNITEEDIENWNNKFTGNYEDLSNKPSINNIELIGNKTLDELGIQSKGNYANKNDIPDTSKFITEKDVPKKTSQLENDSGFATKEDIPDTSKFVEDEDYIHTDNNYTDEDKSKLDSLENFSGNAVDISYEDNTGQDVYNVQEALDTALGIINNLGVTSIRELHNKDVDLLTLPIGIYYLTGKETTIKYSSSRTATNIITSDTQKNVLIALGVYDSYGRGVMFSGQGQSSQTFLHAFGSGVYNNYNLTGLLTTSLSKTITGLFTFNTLPKSGVTPTANNHLTNKAYVDNRFREVKYAIDLGYIDLDDYDGDIYAFMDTITEEGKYKFIDSYDEFEWYVEVYRTDYYAGQIYWGSEEGFIARYYRYGYYNEDDDVIEWDEWENYISYATAMSLFAHKSHFHYDTVSVADIRTWLDEQNPTSKREYEVTQTSNKHKFTVNFNCTNYISAGKTQYIKYQEYYDIEEPNKIYKRTGKASSNLVNATLTWGDWYVFEGTVEN